jgi:peptidoglycan/xylan/chitin deacetylase (PgdA/CDA1 family)
MGYLKSEGYQSITLDDLALWRRGLATLPPKPVVITFDDGDRSVLNIARPILERYGFKATLFVVTSKVGTQWDRVDCLDWEDLKMLETSGVFSIQSHSHDLHRKVRTEEADLPVFVSTSRELRSRRGKHPGISMVFEDLRMSKAILESHLGTESKYLAWPYGFGDAKLDSVAAAAGFDAFCTLRAGRNKRHAIGNRTRGTALWLTDLGALAPKPVFSFNWSSNPARSPIRSTDTGGDWESLEIKRFTITARTSIRTFKEMLDE